MFTIIGYVPRNIFNSISTKMDVDNSTSMAMISILLQVNNYTKLHRSDTQSFETPNRFNRQIENAESEQKRITRSQTKMTNMRRMSMGQCPLAGSGHIMIIIMFTRHLRAKFKHLHIYSLRKFLKNAVIKRTARR